MNKKRYLIIILLIIFLFLSFFTFANPFRDGEGNGNLVEEQEEDKVNKEQDETKEETKKEQTTKEETKQDDEKENELELEDDSYDIALKAIEKAEITLEKEDYNFALELVNKVKNDKKKDLEERLETLLNYINVKELVEKLVDMTKSSKSKLELDAARKYNTDNEVFNKVEELENEILKNALTKVLNNIVHLLDDTTIPKVNIEDGAISDSDIVIIVDDENEVVIKLNGEEIENNSEVSDGTYELVVTDVAFNEVKINFVIDTIAPTATINYSKGELTNEDIVVTLNPSEDIKVTNNDGKFEYTFEKNGEFIFEFEDIAGNKGTATVVVDYIDKELPEAVVTYSNEDLTNENVIVTVTVSEEVKEVEGWELSTDKKVLTKEFTENSEGTIEVIDLAGNKISVDYSVTNIDKELPEAVVSYSTEEFINGNVTVTVEVTKEIKEVEGWELSTDKKELTKEFTKNSEGTIEIVDLAGNKISVDYSVKNIDKSFPTIKGVEDGEHYKEATPIIDDENIESIKINGFNFESGTTIKLNGEFTLVATDKAGNETTVKFNIDNINPKILVLDRLSVIRGDLIPIKPVIIDANLDKVVITLDGEDINYKDGDQLIEPGLYEITATDKAGNTSTTTFTMDNNGPEIYTEQEILGQTVNVKLSGISLGQLLAFKEVNLKVKEDNFDPKSIIVLRKSTINLPFDYSLPTYNKIDYTYGDTITMEGEYIVLAADKALNISYGKFIIDRTKPVIVGVENGKYYDEVEVKVEDANLAATVVSKKILGVYVPTLSTNGDVITESGEYKIEATDKAGNSADSVEFIIDHEAPIINGVKDGYIYSGVTPVISDSNLENVVVIKDGNIIETPNYTEEGIYTITATDRANNSTTVSFEIDKEVLKVENVENGKYYQTSVEPQITNRGEITITLIKNGSEVEYTNSITEEGKYTLKVVDQYENKVELSFVIDKNAPTIYAEDKQVAATLDGSFDVEVDVYDNIDGYTKLFPLNITHTSGKEVTLSKEISTTKDWEGTYTITYKAVDKSGRETTKIINIIVYLADISIKLDKTSLESVYNGENQIDNISACIYDSNDEIVSCDANDIDIKVTDLDGNKKDLIDAGIYKITASVKNKPSEYQYEIYDEMTYEIIRKEVTVEFEATETGLDSVHVYEYDGSNKKYVAKIKETGEVIGTYIAKDEDGNEGINVGTYTITVTANDITNKNYKLKEESTITVRIIKATLYASLPDVINEDGTITISEFKNISGDVFTNLPYTVSYKLKKSFLNYKDVDNMNEVGTYLVTVSLKEENDNYYLISIPKQYEVK